MQAKPPENPSTAALVVIGNEILSGRTQDKNLGWLAKELNESGIMLKESRFILDDKDAIIEAVNDLRQKHSYIFTTGGIGPTHDDITTECIAAAFNRAVLRHPEAEAALTKHYDPNDLNEARLKMADIPEGATLVPNPISAAPGYRLDNVYVFAGVPVIMQAMFAHIQAELKGGKKVYSRSMSAFVTEGNLAQPLAVIQERAPEVEIGSYPFIRQGKLGSTLVMRSADIPLLKDVYQQVKDLMLSLSDDIIEEEPQSTHPNMSGEHQ